MSFQEFIHMGGFGFYIWTSYFLGLIVFVGLIISVKQQRKKLIKQLRRRYQLQVERKEKINETVT